MREWKPLQPYNDREQHQQTNIKCGQTDTYRSNERCQTVLPLPSMQGSDDSRPHSQQHPQNKRAERQIGGHGKSFSYERGNTFMLIKGISQGWCRTLEGNIARSISSASKNSSHKLPILFVDRFVVAQTHSIRSNEFGFTILTAR